MKDKVLSILRLLGSKDSWLTSFAMSAFLNTSVRTVKTYIREINEDYPGLIESSREGFRIADKERLSCILSQTDWGLPQTADDRKAFILRKLLLEKSEYDLDVLAAELCISPITLSNELPKIKAALSDFDLGIKTKSNVVSICGPEANKKKMISKLIYEESKDSFMNVKLMQTYLPNYDLSVVRQIISETLKEYHYFMDDFSLVNLVLHIAITLERNAVAMDAKDDERDWKALVGAHIRRIVESITSKLENAFQVRFPQSDVYNLAILIMTRVISDSINEVNTNRLSEIVGDEIIRIVSLMQSRTKEAYNITITNEDFTIRFSLHLKNLLLRLMNDVAIRNPQMAEIKNTYPFIYDIAVFLANIFTSETGYVLGDDEISYIALHLGVLIEERKVIKHEVRAVLLYPQYYSSSSDYANKLSSMFEDSLMITGIASTPDELDDYADYDMIISTIPISVSAKPVALNSGYLSNKDILSISSKIEEVLKARTKMRIESKLRTIFKEELFFAGDTIKNQQDALNIMAKALYDQGYVDVRFQEKLFERELVSSSAYANIAMPHPLEMLAYKTAVAVSVHPNAIDWRESCVNIVFVLAINIVDRLLFKDIFDFITDIISEEKKLKTLIDAKTYDAFIATIVSFAK